MRTTVTLSEKAAELVNLYSDARGVSKSRAVSDLILRGIAQEPRVTAVDGVPLVDIPGDGPQITVEMIKRAEEEDDIEYFKRSQGGKR